MLRFALGNVLSRPLRSLLALLGLAVAIGGMVGLFSVAVGIDETVSDTFGQIPGLVALQPGAPIPLFSTLPASWADEIRDIPGVRAINREIWRRVHVIDNKIVVSPPRFFFGTDIAASLKLEHSVYRDSLIRGRTLNLRDRGTLNTMISRQIAEEFGKDLGDTLRVDGNVLTIVGVYECGSLLLDVAIILDIDQVRGITRFDPNSISAIYIEPAPGIDDEQLADRIRLHFRGRGFSAWQPSSAFGEPPADNSLSPLSPVRDLFTFLDRSLKSVDAGSDAADSSPQDSHGEHHASVMPDPPEADTGSADGAVTEESPIEIRTATDWADRVDDFKADLDVFLIVMTAIGVIVAVLSIVNTMLMSVSERIVEFGILKANGWTNADVARLITFESMTLGIAGGCVGSVLGWLGTQFVNWYWATKIHLLASPELLLFGIGFAAALGVLGGLYPALWATRMSPMSAIRRG